MANFSQEELELINQQRRDVESLPLYYSADNKRLTQISRDFESFLILQPTEQKQLTLKWVKEANSALEKNVDRDELLLRYAGLRKDDAKLRIEELDEKLNTFDDFKESFLADSEENERWSAVPEVSLLQQSLQQPIDELLLLRDNSFHEFNFAVLVENRTNSDLVNKDTQREISSWQTVVSSYKGTDKAAKKSGKASSVRGAISSLGSAVGV